MPENKEVSKPTAKPQPITTQARQRPPDDLQSELHFENTKTTAERRAFLDGVLRQAETFAVFLMDNKVGRFEVVGGTNGDYKGNIVFEFIRATPIEEKVEPAPETTK